LNAPLGGRTSLCFPNIFRILSKMVSLGGMMVIIDIDLQNDEKIQLLGFFVSPIPAFGD
jgi:hypothetical protein